MKVRIWLFVIAVFAGSGQVPTELPFDATCAGGQGWHYDDPANPQRMTPYPNFKYRLKWDGRYVAGVSKCSAR